MEFLSVDNNKLVNFFDNGFLREFLGIFFDNELILACSHDEPLALHVSRDDYQPRLGESATASRSHVVKVDRVESLDGGSTAFYCTR